MSAPIDAGRMGNKPRGGKRRPRRVRRARPGGGKGRGTASGGATQGSAGVNLDHGWSRAGARTVAGVTYQVAVTAHLLVLGRAGEPAVVSVVPEGDEDIDCTLFDGTRLFVQAKDRAAGDAVFALGDVASVICHARDVLRSHSDARLALVTNATLGGGISETGWQQTLAEALTPDEAAVLAKRVDRDGSDGDEASRGAELLARTHVVRMKWGVASETDLLLAERFKLPPAVARLVRASLVADVAGIASDQRFRTRETAHSRTTGDLDALVQRVSESTDLELLEEAQRKGLVEFIDFTVKADTDEVRFLKGVDVEPAHVAAGLDVPRPRELNQIAEALRRERYALIVGPSGSGKSALVWRTARDHAGLVRPVRVRRVPENDVDTIARWAALQAPSAAAPLLVCADNLGRPHSAGWEELSARLLALPGVLLVGAVRHEDFRPAMTHARAAIVEPQLDQGLALSIAATLEAREVTLMVDSAEAFNRSGPLLMEFLSLLIAGSRLVDVVRAQADARLDPERTTERAALRHVCTAHLVGIGIPPAALGRLVGDADDLGRALSGLDAEHVLTCGADKLWRGMHELRSRVISEHLHRYPPPTLPQTLASLFEALAVHERCRLVRLAALEFTDDLGAVADTAGELLSGVGVGADHAAAMIDALAIADATTHARRCIEVVRSEPTPVATLTLLQVAYTMRETGIEFDIPGLERVAALAARLPRRGDALRARAMAHVEVRQVERLACSGELQDRVAWLEAVDGILTLTPPSISAIWSCAQDGPIASRARVLAALSRLDESENTDPAVRFGPLDDRLNSLVEGLPTAIDASASEHDDGLVVSVRLALPLDPGDAHDRAVDGVRLVLDLCPEAAVAEVITVDADGERFGTGDLEPARKRIPRGKLPPTVVVGRNAAVLDAAAKLLSASYWTDRLRQQARVSRELVRLLEGAPARLLHPRDNAGRRRAWFSALEQVQKAMAQLPALPVEDLNRNTADPCRDALQRLVDALLRFSQHLPSPESSRLRGIGAQIRMALDSIATARATGLPRLASVGEPLPEELDQYARTFSDVVLAVATVGVPRLRPVPKAGETWALSVPRALEAVRNHVIEGERAFLVHGLSSAGVGGELYRISCTDLRSAASYAISGSSPMTPRMPRRWWARFRSHPTWTADWRSESSAFRWWRGAPPLSGAFGSVEARRTPSRVRWSSICAPEPGCRRTRPTGCASRRR